MSDLRKPETGKRKAPKTAFKKGQSGNPGGQSKEKREFLEQMRDHEGDGAAIYRAFMRLVRKGNTPAVIRAMEYVAGKPKETVEHQGVDGSPLGVIISSVLPQATPEELEKLREILANARERATTRSSPAGTATTKPP